MRRKQAAEDKQQDGLRPLRQSPEIVQRFMGVAGIGDLVPGRQGGKIEKAVTNSGAAGLSRFAFCRGGLQAAAFVLQ